MSTPHKTQPQQSPVWMPYSYSDGILVYFGHAPNDGLEWRRHSFLCEPGKWRVGVTAWAMHCNAVQDDFGNLVRVQ